MNLTDMRARVRQDLKDTDSANYIWTDAEVDAAIERVVREFSLAYPKQELSELDTTSGSKSIDISTLTNLLKVLSVEFPTDQDPPYYQHFTTWGTNIVMTSQGDGTKARIKWGSLHTLSDTSTIPFSLMSSSSWALPLILPCQPQPTTSIALLSAAKKPP